MNNKQTLEKILLNNIWIYYCIDVILGWFQLIFSGLLLLNIVGNFVFCKYSWSIWFYVSENNSLIKIKRVQSFRLCRSSVSNSSFFFCASSSFVHFLSSHSLNGFIYIPQNVLAINLVSEWWCVRVSPFINSIWMARIQCMFRRCEDQ